MRYVRRNPAVDALVFTPELGELCDGGKKLALSPRAVAMGISYAEGKGYAYRGKPVKFGDYIVQTQGVKAVWSAKDFEAQFRAEGETT